MTSPISASAVTFQLPGGTTMGSPGPTMVWSPLMNDAGGSGHRLCEVAGVRAVVEPDAQDLAGPPPWRSDRRIGIHASVVVDAGRDRHGK